MFGQMKEMWEMKRKADEIKKKLSQTHIESATKISGTSSLSKDGEDLEILIIMTGEMEIISIKIPDELMQTGYSQKISNALLEAIKKAKKKAEEIAQETMKDLMGGMGGLGAMLGGK